MNIHELYRATKCNVIDYVQVMSMLDNYSNPRMKISKWLKEGSLIRIKKGLYTFGDNIRMTPIITEQLANLIYGPSAISLQYALSYYGLIPEAVHTITSITCRRNKKFQTPIGYFTYQYLNPKLFHVGIDRIVLNEQVSILIATAEKALCDTLVLSTKKIPLASTQQLESFLFDDIRIDKDQLLQLDQTLLTHINTYYHHKKITQLIQYIKKSTSK